ncbi:MAG: hypothetical protein E6G76_22465 [Alphaproteobacteria bacterium]|nr:MAG: hypothetical protein E6G76_22465 [Alphaproteobacteria bacterium]
MIGVRDTPAAVRVHVSVEHQCRTVAAALDDANGVRSLILKLLIDDLDAGGFVPGKDVIRAGFFVSSGTRDIDQVARDFHERITINVLEDFFEVCLRTLFAHRSPRL